ncbi:MAG: NUDIX domain-containing protein [Candidatus Taylorbacteria bacterium]|nr:NUDIX domain-containing protein [Candidatus Taylorbacteria bacterium]
MSEPNRFKVRCRGIILHEGRLLVVRHAPDHRYVALPGGGLEWGEDALACMKREIVEELGVEPKIGRLLYVNTFISGETQSMEFFFEILNGADYVGCEKLDRTHAFELAELLWIKPDAATELLPRALAEDFKNGKLLSDTPRFISDLKAS